MISRCFWYDEDGKPYKRREGGEGCVTARCRFIHPWEKEWSRASPSTRLPPRYLIPYEEEVRLYSPPRERRRERSWSRSRDRDRARTPDRRMRRTTRSRTRSWSRSRSRSRGADRSRGHLDFRVSRRSRSPRRRRSPSHTTTIRSSRSPPRRQPTSSDLPYDTPPDPSPVPSVEANREDTRLPPSEPRALRKPEPSVKKEEPKHESTRAPSQSLSKDKTLKPFDSLPGPSADIAIPADPLTSPTSTAPPQATNTSTSTPPPQVLPPAAAFVTAPIISVDTTSPTIEAPQPIRISPPPIGLLPTETPTRTSSIAGLDDILARLRVQNSVSDMSTPAAPVPVPTPPTETPPPVPASPPPPDPPTILAGTSTNAVPPAEAQASSITPSGSFSNPNEQRKAWEERIELLTDVLQKRESLMSLEESRALYSRIAGTVNSPDDLAERGRYKAESINYSMKRMAKEKEYNDAVGKLTDSEAWRLLRLESGGDTKANRAPKKAKVDADATKMLADIKGTIGSIMDTVKELYGLVQEVGRKQNLIIPTLPGVPIMTPAPAPNLDVEMEPALPQAQSDILLSQSSEQGTPSSLSTFHDTLKAIEDRLTDIEGNLNQRQEEIGEEIQSALETQFHDLKLSLKEPNPMLSEAQKLSQSNSERLTTIGVEIGRTGGEIDELAREVVEAIKVNNEVAQGSESLAQENAWLRDENARLQKALEEMERTQNEQLAVMRAETDEAKALLQEYLSRPPPPQMPALDALAITLVPLVRNALHPLLEDLHVAINELLTTKVSILNESVRQRIQVLWDMVTAFQLWADQVRDGVDPGYLLRRVHPAIHGAQ